MTFSSWPQSSGPGPAEIVDAGSALCLECGLCCRGALFDWFHSNDTESYEFRDTDIEFFINAIDDDDTEISGSLPCRCHVDGRCSIFPDRPETCSRYSCQLLRSVFNGSVGIDDALSIVSDAKQQFDWLVGAANRLRYLNKKNNSLVNLLRDFFYSVNDRARFLPLLDDEREFAANGFQFLQTMDRYFEESFVFRFGELIGAINGYAGSATADSDRSYYRNSSGGLVEFVDCPEVAAPLAQVIRGYLVRQENSKAPADRLDLRIWKIGGRYHWDTPYPGPHSSSDRKLLSLNDVVSDVFFHADLVCTDRTVHSVHVHGAAVEFPAGLVLLLGPHGAGKTTLALELAARGYRIFGDDQFSINVSTGEALSIGRVPVVRLPHDNSSYEVLEFDSFDEYPDWRFVDLADTKIAPLGDRKNIAGIVGLTGSETASELIINEDVDRFSLLETLIKRSNHNDVDTPAIEVVRSFTSLIDSSKIFDLRFGNSVQAADALVEYFSADENAD